MFRQEGEARGEAPADETPDPKDILGRQAGRLVAYLADEITLLGDTKRKPKDVGATGARLRAITAAGRAVVVLRGLLKTETPMDKLNASSPAHREQDRKAQLRAELERRFDRLRLVLEAKGADQPAGRGPDDRDADLADDLGGAGADPA